MQRENRFQVSRNVEQPAADDAQDRQDRQWDPHDRRRLVRSAVRMTVIVVTAVSGRRVSMIVCVRIVNMSSRRGAVSSRSAVTVGGLRSGSAILAGERQEKRPEHIE